MKKFITILLALALSLSLAALFVACGNDEGGKEDGGTEQKNVITASLGKTEATVGEEISVTYSATSGTVTVTYAKDGGESVSFTGNTFTADAAGTYVFTFSAEGAESVTKTLTVTAAAEPVVPVITASADKASIYEGESVTLTWSATEEASVSVTFTKDGVAADTLNPRSGEAFAIGEAGTYVFTFSAEGAESKTVTVTVMERPVITVGVDGDKTSITEGESVMFTFSCSDGAAVSVAVKYNGEDKALSVVSGTAVELSQTGEYVFTFSAANADSVEKTITVVAHTHTYGAWRQESAPTATSAGAIVRECTFDGCTQEERMTLPALTAENVADTATEGKYTYLEEPSTCTAAGTGTYTFYIDTFYYTVALPLAPHTYESVTLPYDESMASDNWKCTVKCFVCDGAAIELTVPNAVSADAESGWTQVSVEKQPSCVSGLGTYRASVERDGKAVTVTVSGVVIPATGSHTYDDLTIAYSDLQGDITDYTETLSCKGGCGTTLTVSGLPQLEPETWNIQTTQEPTCGEDGFATCSYEYTANDSSSQSATITVTITQVTVGATGEHNYSAEKYLGADGMYVVCENCGNKLYIAELNGETLNVAFADGSNAYIGETLDNTDFVVTATFAYITDYDGHTTGETFTVSNTDELFAQYFSNNLNEYDGSWLSEQTVTFALNAEEAVLAEGALTFDVLPDFVTAGINADILEMQSGAVSNQQIETLEGVGETGLSVSFYLDSLTNKDWSAIINNSGMIVGIPNLDPWNNVTGTFQTGINLFPNKEGTGNSQNLYNGGTSVCFNEGHCYVTVTLATDGSASFYKNGVMVVKYLATDTFDGNITVQSFTETLLSLIEQSGFLYAGQATTRDLIVTTALSDTEAWNLFTSIGKTYSNMEISLDNIPVYTTYAGASANNAMIGADTFKDVSLTETGLAVSFYISEAMVYQTADQSVNNLASDWSSYTIKSGAFYITLPNLSAWDAEGNFSQTNKYPVTYENGGNYQSYFGEVCYVTISVNTDGSIDFYKNGERVALYSASESMNGTGENIPTIADFSAALLAQIAQSGFVFAEAVSPAEDLIVTGALTAEQVGAIYSAQQAYRA